jgi:hypothetical protein
MSSITSVSFSSLSCPPCGTILDCGGNEVNIASLNADLSFGLSAEEQVISKLSVKFNEGIKKTEDQYCRYDAVGETGTKYEIKTRRNRFNAFATTIIPVHKTKVEGRLVFVFNFTDKLAYIIYNEEEFSRFEVSDISAIRRGGLRTSIPHYHIPIDRLVVLDI